MDGYIEIPESKLVDAVKAAYELSADNINNTLNYKKEGLTDEEAESMIARGEKFPVSMGIRSWTLL